MGKYDKILNEILSGRSDSNISFSELRLLMKKLGFIERVKGSHHIFYKNEVVEILNLQGKNGKAKSYQIKQIREIVTNYGLNLSDDERN